MAHQSKIQNPKSKIPPEAPSHPIFVRATGAGTSGIATLLLDGWGLNPRLQPRLRGRKPLRETRGGELFLARLTDAAGKLVDEVVVACLDFHETATGHEQIELSCHGGPGALAAVEAALLAAGFARGGPHELLERAHLGGRLSLVALEARLRLAAAATARQADFLLGHEALQTRWERLGFDIALALRARDWSWRESLIEQAQNAVARIDAGLSLLKTHHVALAGPVNAGKSTLANLLARAERHLVSEIPGTTRDRLDLPVAVRGLSLLLSDAAGWRETTDDLEQEGQRRAAQAAQEADLRLIVLAGSQAPGERDLKLIAASAAAGPTLLVLNKQDLGVDETAGGLGFLAGREPCVLSALTGFGMEALEAALETALLGNTAPVPGDPFTRRQKRHLGELVASLGAGSPGFAVLGHICRLVGTRPDPEGLREVLDEAG